MEAEGNITSCFDEPRNKSFAEREQLSRSCSPNASASDVKPSSTACFDCSICMDFAADPMVTLCGHLYCWLCIYKWMQQVGPTSSPRNSCPVCKSPVSLNSLIPLYARGNSSTESEALNAPNRPAVLRDTISSLIEEESLHPPIQQQQQLLHHQHRDYYHYSMLGGLAIGTLFPWVLRSGSDRGELYSLSRLNRLNNYGRSENERQRSQERRVEVWLHQLWVFLFSCVVLCLLFF